MSFPFYASRVSGFGPLACFFRPAQTVPFSSIEITRYVWSVDGVPQFVGFNFSHVFETTGYHLVTVDIYQLGAFVTTQQVYVQVVAWSGTDFYVASSGNDANPGTLAQPWLTIDHAIATLFGTAGPRRLFVNRGDTFTTTSQFTPGNGPYRIGVYGSGAKPVVNVGESWITDPGNGHDDIVFADLDIVGPGSYTPSSGNVAIELRGNNACALRCDFTSCAGGLGFGNTSTQGKYVFDCTLTNSVNIGIGIEGPHIGIRGLTLDGVTNEHLIRVLYFYHGLVAGTTFKNGATNKHHLKIHGSESTSIVCSQRMLVSENDSPIPGNSGQLFSIGPEHSASPEKSIECIVEKNSFTGDSGSHTAIASRGVDWMTVRNNRFYKIDLPIALTNGVANFSSWNDWHIYDNSGYSAAAADVVFAQADNANVKRIVFYNNIMSAPSAGGSTFALDMNPVSLSEITDNYNIWHFPSASSIAFVGGTGYNLAAWQGIGKGANDLTSDPLYTNTTTGDLTLQGGSPALGSALVLAAVYEDINSATRPYSGATPDRGAYETS